MRRDRELLWNEDIDREDIARNGEDQQDRDQHPCADLFNPIHLYLSEADIANRMEYQSSEQDREYTEHHAVCVINGDYYDTWDSGGEVPIYGFKKGD